MREHRNEIEIQATVGEVWRALTDLERYGEWNPFFYRAEGKVEVGETVKISVRSAPNGMGIRCTIVKVEPEREFTWRFHIILPFLFRGEHTFRIEPIDEGRVKFVDREVFEGVLVPTQAIELENAKVGMIEMGEALHARVAQLKSGEL